jgi:hypothetical protein
MFGCAAAAPAQQSESTPIYRVTVVQRNIQAVNYGHRNAATKIDLKGTVLLTQANGEATIESKAGAVTIDAKFEHLQEPARFGPQYLAYVLWAVTPDGRVANLGEIVTDSHEKAHLTTSTPLQAFALMVTAEPYYAVSRPSDVVVMENQVRKDTIGSTEVVNARYDLLPRSEYTYHVGQDNHLKTDDRRKVSVDEYNAIAAIYQARNAVQIAQSKGADRYAGEVYRKAEDLLRQAESYKDKKGNSKQVITLAREATQTAEDALLIANKRNREEVTARGTSGQN